MGQPPRTVFRFTHTEVAKMEEVLRDLDAMPKRPVIQGLTDDFNASPDHSGDGKVPVQYNQVRTWLQNRRYREQRSTRGAARPAQGKMLPTGAEAQHPASYRAQSSSPPNSESHSGNSSSDGGLVQLEAKSPRNGAWFCETGDQEVQVWFSGFGAEEEEWINVCKSVRERSLPCVATECVDVLPGDLILCYQEGKEQALYFDTHVLEVERHTHDIRGCRVVFLFDMITITLSVTPCLDLIIGAWVLCLLIELYFGLYPGFEKELDDNYYPSYQIRAPSICFICSWEIIPLRKVCRRPSADVKIDIVIDHSLAEQKAQKSHKRMDMNPHEATMVPSPPHQGGPSDKMAAPLLITPDSTHRDSIADVQMGYIEAGPKGEATSKAHGD